MMMSQQWRGSEANFGSEVAIRPKLRAQKLLELVMQV